jgi:hypothetical protein
MKILELCPYSNSGCGVWSNVIDKIEEIIK